MALIEIDVKTELTDPPSPAISYYDEERSLLPLPQIRLTTTIVLGQDVPHGGKDDRRFIENVIIDTGASLSFFPHVWWSKSQAPIKRLFLSPDHPNLTLVVGGHRLPIFLGRIFVGIIDRCGRRMPAIPILAKFEEVDPSGLPPSTRLPVLLGLANGIFEGRRLERESVTYRFDPDQPEFKTFGQRWWLRDT